MDPAQPKRFVALDSLRGVAAVLVAMHHFAALGPSRTTLIENSWLLVDLFFVLSGFIISANYRRKFAAGYSIGEFMVLRLARVYPLHGVMLGLWAAAEFLIWAVAPGGTTGSRVPFTDTTSLPALIANLYLVQSIGLGLGQTWNWVSWSISTEIWAYVVFGLLAAGIGKHLDRALLGLAVLTMAFIFLLPPASELVLRWIEFARCLYGFSLGALVYTIHAHRAAGDDHRRTSHVIEFCARWGVLETLALTIAIAFLFSPGILPVHTVHILAPIAFAPAVLVFADDRGTWSRLLAQPLPKLLGQISYSIYLIHPFVQLRIMKPIALGIQHFTGVILFSTETRANGVAILVWGKTQVHGALLTLLMLTIVLPLAMASFRFIEEPARAAMKRHFSTKQRSQPATVTELRG